MLVGYSSSSDEEVEHASELTDSTGKRRTRPVSFKEDCHDRSENKKNRIEQQEPKARCVHIKQTTYTICRGHLL